ncbi:MAG: SDR family NAD(P)-dependent oxidoreductase [Gemmatimonadota bacterium]
MDMGLEGKVALVTGAARGIGAEIARAFALEGCDLCLVDLDEEGIERVAGEIRAEGRSALAVRCDVRNVEEATRAVEQAVEQLGELHVLVCNAGITSDAVVWKMSERAWDDVVDVNLKGCFTMVRAAVPRLRERRWGRIVAVASINGLRGKAGQANYAASKAGLIGLIKSSARELGGFGVTANVVAPGMVMTEMTRRLPESFVTRALDDAALDRLASPRDVADAVVFLCSERARSVTGEVLRVDSGQYI